MRSAEHTLSALFLSDDPDEVLRAAAAVTTLSSGRVRKPETIHRRTGKPERDGLSCARIFGPVEDLRCLCGKFSGAAMAGQECDRCGVLCGERRLRGERWGHVESPVPLVHPRLVARISSALGWRSEKFLNVLRFEGEEEVEGARGLWRIAELLGERANELLIAAVPVTPPDWRGTRRDPQDSRYARLINRCLRLERLIELNAPQIIVDNEARMTQEAFESLCEAVRAELRARGPVVVAPVTRRSAALLAAVYDDPDDDAARLAYAEHLTAAGDPRGEFIALQLARAGRPGTARREADLLRRNLERWEAPLAGAATEIVFRRGFPAACKVAKNCPAPRIGDPAWATIEHLDSDLLELVTDPVMRGLASLALGIHALRGLCEGPWVLPRVHTLLVRLSGCPPPQAPAVTGAGALPGLHTLTLVHRSVRLAERWDWLADTPLARQLERLTLVLPLERVESLALPWWVAFMERHPRLERLDIALGTERLAFALRRDGVRLTLRASVSRGMVERFAMSVTDELQTAFVRCLTALEPHAVASLQVVSPCRWYGDDLAAISAAIERHFGDVASVPRTM